MKSNECYMDVIKKIPEIKVLRVFEFSSNNKIQDREKKLSLLNAKLINDVLDKKSKTESSFWECLFSLAKNGERLDKKIMRNALFHNKNMKYIHYTRSEFIDFISHDVDGDIAINSKVILEDGTERHIPMLDFKIKSNEGNLQTVKDVLSVLDLKGCILDSGKSYHFVGYELKTESELIDMLSYFILLQPISDKAWATHQILERSASLRLSRKYGKYPKIIDYKA